MEKLVKKYADKLVAHRLCEKNMPVLGSLDAELIWNRCDPACTILEEVVNNLNINSILFARPAEPYASILDYLAGDTPKNDSTIYPIDTETRTFLHDIPVSESFTTKHITEALKKRKSVVIPGHGIITYGTVSPEQAFVTYSSVCFSLFVKFFIDYLYAVNAGEPGKKQTQVFKKAITHHKKNIHDKESSLRLKEGPFKNKEEVLEAIIEAGKHTVDYRMVDSFFGNVSYKLEDTIYITQTGSSLDELRGCIDSCPMNESSCAGITASSELTAHQSIYQRTNIKAILHGHPKFCVIMSLFCEKPDCSMKGLCHIKCPTKRSIQDIPIVPGEVGTGPYGLCHTLPLAIKDKRGVIVFGHGLFTTGKRDFSDAFNNLIEIENMCLREYLKKIR